MQLGASCMTLSRTVAGHDDRWNVKVLFSLPAVETNFDLVTENTDDWHKYYRNGTERQVNNDRRLYAALKVTANDRCIYLAMVAYEIDEVKIFW